MPKVFIDYNNVYFYKIVCKDLNVTECYVGHTTNFTNRKNQHKCACTNDYTSPVYQFIRSNGGWDNWDMILIEQCRCEGSLDAKKRERDHLEHLKASLNAYIPTRTRKERYEVNKEKVSEQMKEYNKCNKERIHEYQKQYLLENKERISEQRKTYREANKDKIQEYATQKYTCACGSVLSQQHKLRHERSAKHQ